MASFEAALSTGIKLIELDVQMTRDGHLVVIHDPELDRTTDGSGPVCLSTLAQLEKLDAGSWFDPRFSGEKIPPFTQVLEWARDKIQLVVEIKNDGYPRDHMDRVVDNALAAVEETGMAGGTAFISFDHAVVGRISRSGVNVPTGCLIKPRPLGIGNNLQRSRKIARESGCSFILHHHLSTTKRLVTRLASYGLPVITWTVNTEAEINRQLKLGVAGTASNDPGLLVAILSKSGIRL